MLDTDAHSADADNGLANARRRAEQRYAAANPNSERRHRGAASSLPGGNTRSGLHFDPFPLALRGGQDQYLTDLDGHVYADFLGEYSAGLYGRSHPVIMAAVRTALDDGISLGGPNVHEARFADLLTARFPSVEQVRFTNSGTEANLMALATAREFTGRPKILVFDGGYHGGVLNFRGHSPLNVPYPTVTGTFNDVEGTRSLIERHADDLAAVIVEPVIGGGGVIPGTPEFLRELRDATSQHGVVLIFDEVMTSRLGPGGMQERVGVRPDLTTFGKYLGAGFSFGAFGGDSLLMTRYDPAHPRTLSHPGTFNNNTVTMAAGVAGLREVYPPEVAIAHNRRGDVLRTRLNTLFAEEDVAIQATGIGSLIGIHFQRTQIRTPDDIVAASDKRALLHLEMLACGCYFARRGYLALSLPLEQADYDAFTDALGEVIDTYRHIWRD